MKAYCPKRNNPWGLPESLYFPFLSGKHCSKTPHPSSQSPLLPKAERWRNERSKFEFSFL